MARKQRTQNAASASDTLVIEDNGDDAQNNASDQAAGATTAEAPANEATNATEAGDSAPAAEPAPKKTGLTPIEKIRRERDEVLQQYQAAEHYHNAVSLDYYSADKRAKSLKKERDEALERLSNLKNELDYLTARAEEIKDAPAPLFEQEIAREWREFGLDMAGIEGALAQKLIEAGVEKLGQIAGTRLTDIAGIGPESAAKIADLMGEFFAQNPRYARDESGSGSESGGSGEVAAAGSAGEGDKTPARIRVRGGVSGEDYEIQDGEEFDVLKYEDGAATVDLGDGCSVDIPFGSYAVLAWGVNGKRKGKVDEADDVPAGEAVESF